MNTRASFPVCTSCGKSTRTHARPRYCRACGDALDTFAGKFAPAATRTLCLRWTTQEFHECNVIVPADADIDAVIWEDIFPEIEDSAVTCTSVGDRTYEGVDEEDDGLPTFNLTTMPECANALGGTE